MLFNLIIARLVNRLISSFNLSLDFIFRERTYHFETDNSEDLL